MDVPRGGRKNDSVSECKTLLSLKPRGKAGQGDCCVTPYAVDNTYDRIMLRFRPIAPKPAPSTGAGGSSSGGSSLDSNKGSRGRCIRGGRSNITASEKKNKRNIARCLSWRTPEEEMDRVTLPMLPPPDNHKGNNYCSRVICSDVTGKKEGNCNSMRSRDRNYEAGVEGEEEGVMRLRDDACPCFISDGEGRVRWLNDAFKRMVDTSTTGEGGGDRGREEAGTDWSFLTCRVRMVCTWLGMKMGSITSPCDVWRLDGGDFAWRLDVGSALRLGF